MSALENIKDTFKHFRPTTWSVKNKTAIYLVMLVFSLMCIYQFVTLPKEQFPDIVIPTIYVQTIYVGNSPKDIENLVTDPAKNSRDSVSEKSSIEVSSEAVLAASSLFGSAALAGLAASE